MAVASFFSKGLVSPDRPPEIDHPEDDPRELRRAGLDSVYISIDSADAALRLFHILKDKTTFEIGVVREGESKVVRYQVK